MWQAMEANKPTRWPQMLQLTWGTPTVHADCSLPREDRKLMKECKMIENIWSTEDVLAKHRAHDRHKRDHHFSNQTNMSWRQTAMKRTITSRWLKAGQRETTSDARICWSSWWMCDVRVASWSAVSRCWCSNGSSTCCNVVLSHTACESWAASVNVCCWSSSSRNIITTHQQFVFLFVCFFSSTSVLSWCSIKCLMNTDAY